jgi:hypothetical protein
MCNMKHFSNCVRSVALMKRYVLQHSMFTMDIVKSQMANLKSQMANVKAHSIALLL